MSATKTVNIRNREYALPIINTALRELQDALTPDGSNWSLTFAVNAGIESAVDAMDAWKRGENYSADVELTEAQQRLIVEALNNRWQRIKDDDDYNDKCLRVLNNMKEFFHMPNME